MRRLLVLSLVALAGWPATAPALELSGIGLRAGYTAPQTYDATLLVGAHAEFSKPDRAVRFVPSLVYWESKTITDLNPNVDLVIAMDGERRISPYMGLGLSIHFFNVNATETFARDTGGNLFAGVGFEGTPRRYFLETRYTITDMSQFSVLAGVTFATP